MVAAAGLDKLYINTLIRAFAVRFGYLQILDWTVMPVNIDCTDLLAELSLCNVPLLYIISCGIDS